jgi:hypothetical protein
MQFLGSVVGFLAGDPSLVARSIVVGDELATEDSIRRHLRSAHSEGEVYPALLGEIRAFAQTDPSAALRVARTLKDETYRTQAILDVARTAALAGRTDLWRADGMGALADASKGKPETSVSAAYYALSSALIIRHADPGAAESIRAACAPSLSAVKAKELESSWLGIYALVCHPRTLPSLGRGSMAFANLVADAALRSFADPNACKDALAAITDDSLRQNALWGIALTVSLNGGEKLSASEDRLFDPALTPQVLAFHDRLSEKPEETPAPATPAALLVCHVTTGPGECAIDEVQLDTRVISRLAKEQPGDLKAVGGRFEHAAQSAVYSGLSDWFAEEAQFFDVKKMARADLARRYGLWRYFDDRRTRLLAAWTQFLTTLYDIDPKAASQAPQFAVHMAVFRALGASTGAFAPLQLTGAAAVLGRTETAAEQTAELAPISDAWPKLLKTLRDVYRSRGIRAQPILGGSYADIPASFCRDTVGCYVVPAVAKVDAAKATEMWKDIKDWQAQCQTLAALAATQPALAVQLAEEPKVTPPARMYAALLQEDPKAATDRFLAAYADWGKSRKNAEECEEQMVALCAGRLATTLARKDPAAAKAFAQALSDPYLQAECLRVELVRCQQDANAATTDLLSALADLCAQPAQQEVLSLAAADGAIAAHAVDRERSAQLLADVKSPAHRAYALAALASRVRASGDGAAAEDLLKRAAEALNSAPDSPSKAYAGCVLARVCLGQDLDAPGSIADLSAICAPAW